MTDLRNIDELKQACSDAVASQQSNPDYISWGENLRRFFSEVQSADLKTRSTEAFQRKIWDDNPVSKPGMGNIRIDAAIADAEFRTWLAEQSVARLPDAPDLRAAALDAMLDGLEERVVRYTKNTPRLKMYRVLAGFFPSEFTTVSDIGKAKRLHSAMFGNRRCKGPSCHANILRRLSEAIGPAGDDLGSIVDRIRLPWLLFAHYVAPAPHERTETPEVVPGDERLVPLPAARRRKGLTGVSGGRQALLNILEFCRDGALPEDLAIHVKTVNPHLKENSIKSQISVIKGELNCLKSDGNSLVLTDRGHAFLESDDPAELMDWLVTRILGVDHAMVILRNDARSSRQDLVNRIQTANPGWESTRVPRTIVNEMRDLDMLDIDESDVVTLTDAGKEWARRIHWQPESLKLQRSLSDEAVAPQVDHESGSVRMPDLEKISGVISKSGHFPERIVQKLHAGLWANKRRHFAVLAGLSGSGKTLLARSYGKAIAGEDGGSGRHLRIVPVQPGWYDPSALLGYVNPLQGDSYVRTPFLEFLIAAGNNPNRPFTVVLDEMNLSRPEQYLAPILSAMETGEALILHREGELFDGVPTHIRYPGNLAIIGTVNMDETTHGLSDKVLDRAFTIEFWDVNLEDYPHWGKRGLADEHENIARKLLDELMRCLRPARLHFGWRVVDDVLDYMERAFEDGGETIDPIAVLDDVVYAKVLPKLRGEDSQRFREALSSSDKILKKHKLEACSRKVGELSEDLELTGSARFWR